MFAIKTTTNHLRREITTTATDSHLGCLASETRIGTGSRAQAALETEVRRLGEQQLSRMNLTCATQAAAGSVSETRLLTQRLAY